jgi:uncharacterized phage protein gp47/JayE
MFERKSMEEIVQRMTDWTRGATTKLTDFRVGSRVRTMYEATAIIVEELYDKVYRAHKVLIEENVYTVLGFPKRPATYALGTVTFGRLTPSDSNYLIAAGTVVRTKATQTSAPIDFRTTADVLLAIGQTSITAPVVATSAGASGNVDTGTIVDFVTKPSGIETVTNGSAVQGGLEQETRDEQKVRFVKYLKSLMRGTLAAIEYGALTAELKDGSGTVTERVTTSRAFEFLPARKGEVDVYIWNGVGAASTALKDRALEIITGYYDPLTGEPVYGYKPAGILVTIYSATSKAVTIKLALTSEAGYSTTGTAGTIDLRPFVQREVDDFFYGLGLGQTLVQTALESRIKQIAGVYDVKLTMSTGGAFTDTNITAGITEILKAATPIQYV